MQAFEQGFRAYVGGAPAAANPYDLASTDGQRWRRGWKTADLLDARRMSIEEIDIGLAEILPSQNDDLPPQKAP